MPFEVVFGLVAVVVALGFATVIGLIVVGIVRAARDPAYRARLEAQRLLSRGTRASSSTFPGPLAGPPYDPALDPGNPGSPMFPGNPGNPL